MIDESIFQKLLFSQDPLVEYRKKAWEQLQILGPPHRKQEAFQYLPLQKLRFPPLKEPSLPRLSSLPFPCICLPLEEAIRSYGAFLHSRLEQGLKEEKDPFVALNGAVQEGGLFLYLPPHTQVKEPLEIEQLFASDSMSSPRLHLYLGKGARLQIIQRTEGGGFFNGLLDAVLDEGAELILFDLPTLTKEALYFQALRVTLKTKSQLQYVTNSQGAALSRTSLQVELRGEECKAVLQGLSQLDQERQNHIHALVRHRAPHCSSRQHFKSVLRDRSAFSFEGKIHVDAVAQKTEAYQLNNNLLLSDEAVANAKPNLEIFADDVKASHGATVGQLDEEALFYLRTRGLSLDAAKRHLVDSFCHEILETLP